MLAWLCGCACRRQLIAYMNEGYAKSGVAELRPQGDMCADVVCFGIGALEGADDMQGVVKTWG